MPSKQFDQLPDGLYFDLPEDEYHGQNRLSSSFMKVLGKNPLKAWRESWMNPGFEPSEDTPAKKRGSAVHKLVLEGVKAFDDAYAEPYEPKEHLLKTAEQLKAACKKRGLTQSGSKADLEMNLVAAEPAIKNSLESTFHKKWARKNRGKIALSASEYSLARHMGSFARNQLTRIPAYAAMLTQGQAEVTILWTQRTPWGHVVKMKSRLDRLTPDTILDLKTFSNSRDAIPMHAVDDQINNLIYYLQFETYRLAVESIPGLVKSSAVFGEDESGLADYYSKRRSPLCQWLFIESDPFPNVLCPQYTPERYGVARSNRLTLMALVARFANHLEEFGTDPWMSIPDPGLHTHDPETIKPWQALDSALMLEAA